MVRSCAVTTLGLTLAGLVGEGSVSLCLVVLLLWKLTRGSRYVFSFCLVFEALIYTLFWCYLAYGAVCVARIIVSVFWVLD